MSLLPKEAESEGEDEKKKGEGSKTSDVVLREKSIVSATSDSDVIRVNDKIQQEPTKSSKQPIRTRYLGHVTGYKPIRD